MATGALSTSALLLLLLRRSCCDHVLDVMHTGRLRTPAMGAMVPCRNARRENRERRAPSASGDARPDKSAGFQGLVVYVSCSRTLQPRAHTNNRLRVPFAP